MRDEVRTRCVAEGRKLTPCTTLEKALGEPNGGQKGISMLVLSNVNTGETTRTGVSVRSGDYSKRGVMLNFCPFCGEDVVSHFDAEAAAEMAERKARAS